jgi:class 3 adenylate cyclase
VRRPRVRSRVQRRRTRHFRAGGISTPGSSRAPAVAELEGERRRVIVMFCDMADSTQISGRLDPETFSELVDTFYQVCGEAISRRNGFVANYLGDGLLVLFGYPEAGETSARDAIATGLDIQLALRDLDSRGGISGEDVSARIGIHSGLVVVKEVGTPGRRETHVLGDVVNITARIQTAADAGQIVVTSEVVNRVGTEFTLEALGARPLKGVGAPVALYGVLGTAGASSGAGLNTGPILWSTRRADIAFKQVACGTRRRRADGVGDRRARNRQVGACAAVATPDRARRSLDRGGCLPTRAHAAVCAPEALPATSLRMAPRANRGRPHR